MATESTTKNEKKAADAAGEPKDEELTDSSEAEATADAKPDAAAEKAAEPSDAVDDEPQDEAEVADPWDSAAGHEDADDLDDGRRSGLGAGAAAIVSTALGLCSLTGTSLGEMIQARKQLMGNIDAQMGKGGDQIQAMYGGPWHMTALFNGVFAVLAVLVGAVLLGVLSNRRKTAGWIRPVALGGLILGVVGLVVSGGMFFDLFAPAPTLPGQ